MDGHEFGHFAMPSHPPERGLKAGHDFDLKTLRWLLVPKPALAATE